MTSPIPTEDLAYDIAQDFGVQKFSIKRMMTGLCHYVYEVTPKNGDPIVIRIARPENRKHIQGAVYWYDCLRAIDVPLPDLLKWDPGADFPYMILERLPGIDLGEVYTELSEDQKRKLAQTLQSIQSRVNALPQGKGYGYVESYEQDFPHQTIFEANTFERHREWLETAGVFDTAIVDHVESAYEKFKDYFSTIPPQPFLHDITTKNVIVSNGKLSGIVDVDSLCFGDPVRTIALTQTSLLHSGYGTTYIDYWCEAAKLNDIQRRALALYTADSAVYFLGELGQNFNKDDAIPVDFESADKLIKIIASQLQTATLDNSYQNMTIDAYINPGL